MTAFSLVTPPPAEPITLAEMKQHLRVDIGDDDAYIYTLITAARAYVERITWSSIITQTWDFYLDAWPQGGAIFMPRGPLQSVTSVKYVDSDGVEATVSSSSYQVDAVSRPPRVALKPGASWPSVTLQSVNGVVVRFVAGYGDDGGHVPPPLNHAMKMLVTDWYESRENTVLVQGMTRTNIDFAVKALIEPYRYNDMRVIQ